jgi:uncharacterized repeat protein (TIGR03803 family)
MDGADFIVLKTFSALSTSLPGTNCDGAAPMTGLSLDGNTLLGTTSSGGSAGCGVVFSLVVAPQIRVSDTSFGIRSNLFGFNATGISNRVVIIEGCADLTTSNWLPLQTNTLGVGPIYFTDPAWSNFHGRFFRARTP